MIRVATLAPASFIMANMRPGDRREVMCQVPEGTRTAEIAYGMLMGSDAWCAWDKQDRPACFFGMSPINAVCLSAWAIGTRHMWRVVPEVTEFWTYDAMPKMIARGYRTMEARSIVGHDAAHRWMRRTGAELSGEPFEYGRDGELFQLFRWTVAGYHSMTANTRRLFDAHRHAGHPRLGSRDPHPDLLAG